MTKTLKKHLLATALATIITTGLPVEAEAKPVVYSSSALIGPVAKCAKIQVCREAAVKKIKSYARRSWELLTEIALSGVEEAEGLIERLNGSKYDELSKRIDELEALLTRQDKMCPAVQTELSVLRKSLIK